MTQNLRKSNLAGVALTKTREGCRLKPYLDTGRVWTIGWGHVILPGEEWMMKGITQLQADELLINDLGRAERSVRNLVKVELNDNQFSALVNLVYNIGSQNFAKSTLLRRLNDGDYAAVPDQFRRWVYDDGKKLSWLEKCREAEVQLWLQKA